MRSALQTCPRYAASRRLPRWPGRHSISNRRIRRPQPARVSLANNLPANAADLVEAVHGPDNGQPTLPRQGVAGCRHGARTSYVLMGESWRAVWRPSLTLQATSLIRILRFARSPTARSPRTHIGKSIRGIARTLRSSRIQVRTKSTRAVGRRQSVRRCVFSALGRFRSGR